MDKVGKNLFSELAGTRIFGSLAASDQQRLETLMTLKSYSPNEEIFTQGNEAQGFYLVRTGKFKICADDPQGNELIFTFCLPGPCWGNRDIRRPNG